MSNKLEKMWKDVPRSILRQSSGILLEGGVGKTVKDFMVVTVQTIFERGTSESN
jgi:molybdopterin biosynthesis enzyme MoaB